MQSEVKAFQARIIVRRDRVTTKQDYQPREFMDWQKTGQQNNKVSHPSQCAF